MDDKRFWDRYSKNYSALMRRSERMYLQIHKAIRPFLKRDMDVLEIILPSLIQRTGIIKKCAFAV